MIEAQQWTFMKLLTVSVWKKNYSSILSIHNSGASPNQTLTEVPRVLYWYQHARKTSYVVCAFVYSSIDTLSQFKIEGIKDKNNAINRINETKSIKMYSKYSCNTQKNSSYVQRKTCIDSTQV